MAPSRLASIAALAALAAGCGGEEPTEAVSTGIRAPISAGRCVPAATAGFRVCGQPGPHAPEIPSRIQRRDGDSAWHTVAGPPDRTIVDGVPHGHWVDVWLSPDGKTLLAQWSGECKIPTAFFVSAGGPDMRPVTGEEDWTDSPESIALGWNPDGRARVRLTKGFCGGAKHPPGVYLIDPVTHGLTRVAG